MVARLLPCPALPCRYDSSTYLMHLSYQLSKVVEPLGDTAVSWATQNFAVPMGPSTANPTRIGPNANTRAHTRARTHARADNLKRWDTLHLTWARV